MRIYVAGRFRRYERVRALVDAIAAQGHEITHDWTRNCEFGPDGHLLAPDEASIPPERLAACAHDDVRGAAEADLLVCIADEPLTGALIEIGAALAHGAEVWIIAPWRESIFWHLDLVTRFTDEASVLATLAPLAP